MLTSNSICSGCNCAPGTVPILATAWFVGCWSCKEHWLLQYCLLTVVTPTDYT